MSDKSGHAAEARTAGSNQEARHAQKSDMDLWHGIHDVIDMDNVETIQSARALLSIALLTSRIRELHHRLDEIDLASQRVRTALVSLSTIRGVVDDAKVILRTGSAFSDVASYPALAATFNEFCIHIDLLVEESSLDDVNLLKGTDFTVKFNEDGSRHFMIKGADLTAAGLGISRLHEDSAGEAEFLTKIRELTSAAQKLGVQSTLLEGALTVINSRRNFTKKIVRTLDQSARQITEDKTGRSSFYQTVSSLLGASARHQLEVSIARLSPDYEISTSHKTIADQLPQSHVPHASGNLDEAADSQEAPDADPAIDTAANTQLVEEDETELDILTAQLSELTSSSVAKSAEPCEPAPADETKHGTENTKEEIQAAGSEMAPVGPLDLALASLDRMYLEISDDELPPEAGDDTPTVSPAKAIIPVYEPEPADEEPEQTPVATQKKPGSIRTILDRLRRGEREERTHAEQTSAENGKPHDAIDNGSVDRGVATADAPREHDDRAAEHESAQPKPEPLPELITENAGSALTFATMEVLSASLLKSIDSNAYAEARSKSETGDTMIYARLFSKIVSKRGDDLHDAFMNNETFRADVRQFKLSFLHLIKSDIEEDQNKKPDTLIGKWLCSVYGEIYKGLHRNCSTGAN